jgi:hypothetical protein
LKKIKKFVGKKYLALPPEQICSLIKYFAIPKGVIDNAIQDWRIVFHTGRICLGSIVQFTLHELTLIHNTQRNMGEGSRSHSQLKNVPNAGCVGLATSWALPISIRMCLILKEVIRGDRHDPDDAFEWNTILLNLPGTGEYM